MALNPRWTVHKFGGTSVANAERFKNVLTILQKESEKEKKKRKGVVVSAMSGVTNDLILTSQLAIQQAPYPDKVEEIRIRHIQTIQELLGNGAGSEPIHKAIQKLQNRINSDCQNLSEILRGIELTRSCSQAVLELISGYGELWSAQILNEYFLSQGISSQFLDARRVLFIQPNELSPANWSIDWKNSRHKIDSWLSSSSFTDYVIITGYVASMPDGLPTTLGRNGSDFSASIFGALLNSTEITIWTDVNGVLSADPRLVPDAVVLDEMSYLEATELAYFGAKVLHPRTMAPAIEGKIPIWIRNTYNPSHPGTQIHHAPQTSHQTVKGFATIDRVALMNIEGTGMLGVPGVAQRLFGALREVQVSVTMISQASSEHSICFAIPERQAALAKSTIETAFAHELGNGQIQTISVDTDCTILAAVGDNMVHRQGVSGHFFSSLGKAGVSIRAIAQGSSERNISVVINTVDAKRALRAAHASFYLSNQTISIGVIGPGLIGGTFLNQLHQQSERLKSEFKIDLRVRGITGSKKTLLASESEGKIPLHSWKAELENQQIDHVSLDQFVEHVATDYLPHSVIIDCTASALIAQNYPKWLNKGLHIITPNKRANSGSMEFYNSVREASKSKNRHFLYETNVGAGLPIISSLRDLIQTGDQIEQIEGVFSGTLSYLLNSFGLDSSRRFSQLVQEAKGKGYTEPDPKEDLSGADVARKLVILAREAGLSLELNQISVESLAAYSDDKMDKLLQDAQSRSECLRYVGSIHLNPLDESKPAEISVKLKSYPLTHPFSRCTGTDNMVAFQTVRYHSQPLIIQGPGAGPEVTAAGVFADLLRLASYLGSP